MKTYNFQGRQLSKEDFIKEISKIYAREDYRIQSNGKDIKRGRIHDAINGGSYHIAVWDNLPWIQKRPMHYYKKVQKLLKEAEAKQNIKKSYEELHFDKSKNDALLKLVQSGRTSSELFKEIYETENLSKLQKITDNQGSQKEVA